ncbi:uncharacterized protein LOC124956112 isoform X2 [Vespa velutina]|uniref:uncharacterized protein LOC124956112 isoform X2 n=1 Tax=Vespa velutina TaxID=202808 RepID=UPI001FB2DAB1|nr:uncharacterized protein LOC124956112 isoform X2 [Vespa velutina]
MDFEMNLTIRRMQLFLPCLCTIITYYTVIYNFTTVKLIYAHLMNDYEQLLDDKELDIVKRYNKENRIYMLLTARLTALAVIAFVTFTTYLVLVQHACNQFSILIMKTLQPFKKKQNSIEQDFYYSGPQKEHDWIVDIINRHIKTTQFIDLINSLSEMIYLIEIFFGMIIIIVDFIYTFQIVLENTSETVACCIYIVTSLFLIYINFYIGQKLLDHSNATYMELCKVPFYALTVKTQKLFLFIVARSMKSAELSIGGLFVSSHEVFAALIQKAFSVATVYYNMQ